MPVRSVGSGSDPWRHVYENLRRSLAGWDTAVLPHWSTSASLGPVLVYLTLMIPKTMFMKGELAMMNNQSVNEFMDIADMLATEDA